MTVTTASAREVALRLVDEIRDGDGDDRAAAVPTAALALDLPVDVVWGWVFDTAPDRADLLESPHLPTALADRILLGTDEYLAYRVAENARCSPTALRTAVREWGPDTSDPYANPSEVLVAVAANPSMPAAVLAELVDLDLHRVSMAVARNPAAAAETLRELVAGNDGGSGAVVVVAANPACPTDLVDAFAASEDWSLRNAVAENPAAPQELLDTLCSDINWAVADSARAELARRRDERQLS